MDISLKFIETENVAPTLEEIMNFMNGEKTEEEKQEFLKNALEVVQKNQIKPDCFKKGELVKVIEGDLRNMVGVVIEINDNQVTIMPKDCEISEMI